jgi:RNA-directed DNA polymerase
MKRTGNLFPQILDRDNLRLAAYKAAKGKRDRRETQRFLHNLDRRLAEMARQLRAGTFPLGRYHQFVIHDPKERIITAPCFAERVLHHAIMNICEPVFERWLIADTYACRAGKGRVLAVQRARQFAGRSGYFLKLDIRKYFDSLPHAGLLDRLQRRFKDRALLTLFEGILTTFRGAQGRGVPIGSLTSQHFANFYLGWFDRFIKEKLRIRGYVRYMDDMALWDNDPATLKRALSASEAFITEELGLEFKPTPYLNRTTHGMDFLGCRVFRRHVVLTRRSRIRFRRRLLTLEDLYRQGDITEQELQQRATALVAFTRAAGVCSWKFRQRVLEASRVRGQEALPG